MAVAISSEEKVPPALLDQVPLVAEPLTEPPNAAEVPSWHIWLRAGPALAKGISFTVIDPVAVTAVHAPPVVVTV